MNSTFTKKGGGVNSKLHLQSLYQIKRKMWRVMNIFKMLHHKCMKQDFCILTL